VQTEVVELEELLKNKQLTFADIEKLNIFKSKINDKNKNILFDPSEYIDINIKDDREDEILKKFIVNEEKFKKKAHSISTNQISKVDPNIFQNPPFN
jgi:phage anti-repressor protein